jgi:maltose-binding protein MalE
MGIQINYRHAIAALLISIIGMSCSSPGTLTPTVPASSPTFTPSPEPPTPSVTIDPRPTETSVPDVEGSVRIWLDWSLEEIQAIKPNFDEFHELFPHVQIEISYYAPEQILEDYRQAVLDGNGPSILIGKSQWASDLFAAGMVRDISDRVSAEMEEIITPVAWESVQQGRIFFGLPFSIDGIVLYRNPMIIDAPPDTVDVMREVHGELTLENKAGAIVDIGFLYTGAFFSTCEGQFVQSDDSLGLTHKALECWLRLLEALGESGSGIQNTDLDFNSFLAGEIGWLIEGSWRVDEIISEFGVGGVAIDPWPTYSTAGNNLAGYAWTRNIYFSSSMGDQEFDAAWLFARYLLTEDVQGSLAHAESGRQLPVLTNLDYESGWLPGMMDVLHGSIPLPEDPVLQFFSEELEPAAFDVVRRKYDPYWISQWAMSNITRALSFRGGKIQ